MRRNLTSNSNDRIEIAETVDGSYIVKLDGFQDGGEVDSSGAGNLTFPTRIEALAHARTLGLSTVGDLARSKGWEVCELDAGEVGAEDDVCGLSRVSYGAQDRVGKARDHAPERDQELFLISNLLSGSDYSGSSVERANFRAFLESFRDVPGIVEMWGGHGTYAIAIRLDVHHAEILETLERLEDYPVVDDDTLSELEMEMDSEAWESWARADFRREVCARFGVDISEVSDDDVFRVFSSACDATSTYFECDGADRFIRVEEVAKGCELDALRALDGAIVEEDAEETRTRSARRDIEKPAQRKAESYAHGGGCHRLKSLAPQARYPFEKFRELETPAHSMAECENCARVGWVDASATSSTGAEVCVSGALFSEHCGHGLNPETHCGDCGQPRDAAPGIVGAWITRGGGGFGSTKAGDACKHPTHPRAPRTAPEDSDGGR